MATAEWTTAWQGNENQYVDPQGGWDGAGLKVESTDTNSAYISSQSTEDQPSGAVIETRLRGTDYRTRAAFFFDYSRYSAGTAEAIVAVVEVTEEDVRLRLLHLYETNAEILDSATDSLHNNPIDSELPYGFSQGSFETLRVSYWQDRNGSHRVRFERAGDASWEPIHTDLVTERNPALNGGVGLGSVAPPSGSTTGEPVWYDETKIYYDNGDDV